MHPNRQVEPPRRIRVAVAGPELEAYPGLRVAPVMAEPQLDRGRQRRPVRERERARAVEHRPQPAPLAPCTHEVPEGRRDPLRRGAHPEHVGQNRPDAKLALPPDGDRSHMTTPKSPKRRTRTRQRLSGRSQQKGTARTYRGSAMMKAIFAQIDKMQRTPRSGVAMCHRQGKTAVYLSDDRKYIIEEPPHGGPIKRTLRSPEFRGQ